ncbi:hypothetical protein NSU_1468 [Novosphingobium pentaromativorans US6-1]|uniref:Uncharacterized protein n=1 Tax=Novosphingobium pentaromativorans US6-1 TaxID=1088721 RepID=G6EAS0_9SPHN|nr:hypothetical protein NSU_1468 [Novosphingobium pentaromativorans US6-1]
MDPGRLTEKCMAGKVAKASVDLNGAAANVASDPGEPTT